MQQRILRSYLAAQGDAWNPTRGRLAYSTAYFFTHFAVHAHVRPIARAWMSSARDRREQPELGWALLVHCYFVQKQWQSGIIPCERCAWPTGSWCDNCDDGNRAVCGPCERDGCSCHGCSITEMHDYRQVQILASQADFRALMQSHCSVASQVSSS